MRAGRITYAFNAKNRDHFEEVAVPSGKRPILLSAFYLNNDPKLLEKWRKYSYPHKLILDSGIYTYKSKLGYDVKGLIYHQLTAEEQIWFIRDAQEKVGDDIEAFAREYRDFLKASDGLFDAAVDLDVDEFLGVPQADKFYRMLCEGVPSDKVIRVWHTTRSFDDWIMWCEDPDISYLAIEGGRQHKRDPITYRRFVNYAVENGKNTHVLALTTAEFLRKVPVTTVDSSSFLQGGRHAQVWVPRLGVISFGRKVSNKRHFSRLTTMQQEHTEQWAKRVGMTIKDFSESWTNRCVANLHYFDEYVDVPYKELAMSINLFDGKLA